jgi:hypothetical protein
LCRSAPVFGGKLFERDDNAVTDPPCKNVGLGDSKLVDAQAGLERGMTFMNLSRWTKL